MPSANDDVKYYLLLTLHGLRNTLYIIYYVWWAISIRLALLPPSMQWRRYLHHDIWYRSISDILGPFFYDKIIVILIIKPFNILKNEFADIFPVWYIFGSRKRMMTNVCLSFLILFRFLESFKRKQRTPQRNQFVQIFFFRLGYHLCWTIIEKWVFISMTAMFVLGLT